MHQAFAGEDISPVFVWKEVYPPDWPSTLHNLPGTTHASVCVLNISKFIFVLEKSLPFLTFNGAHMHVVAMKTVNV